MLLYSLISLSLSNLLAAAHPDEPYHPVVIGFPFSVRPFLLPIISSSPLPPPHSDPSSDLAIRITFSQIQLPFLPFPLPFPLSSSANVDAAQRVKAAALRGAKLAKQQFAQKLSAETRTRGLFHAEAHSLVLQRLLCVFFLLSLVIRGRDTRALIPSLSLGTASGIIRSRSRNLEPV